MAQMAFIFPPRRLVLEVAETLAIALFGGVTFAWLGLPAGLVSGSVLAVAPETLRGVATWPTSIALLMAGSIAMMVATSQYLRVVHRWDSLSALFGASPGSLAQVISLATELGGDLRAIAIVQTVRVLLIVVGLPNGLALLGLEAPAIATARGPAGMAVLGEMALLVAVATACAVLFQRLRFPGGLLFGAMTGSAILHGTGFIHAVLPWWIGSSCVIVLGGVVGSRFANTTFRMLLGFLGAAFGSFAVSMAVATIFVFLVVHFLSFPVPNVVIAFAPGAQDTMMVLALALHLDPVYVGAHHLARFLVVTFSVAIGARRIAGNKPRRFRGRREETELEEPSGHGQARGWAG